MTSHRDLSDHRQQTEPLSQGLSLAVAKPGIWPHVSQSTPHYWRASVTHFCQVPPVIVMVAPYLVHSLSCLLMERTGCCSSLISSGWVLEVFGRQMVQGNEYEPLVRETWVQIPALPCSNCKLTTLMGLLACKFSIVLTHSGCSQLTYHWGTWKSRTNHAESHLTFSRKF